MAIYFRFRILTQGWECLSRHIQVPVGTTPNAQNQRCLVQVSPLHAANIFFVLTFDTALIFEGVDGAECEQFIQAIRQHAFAAGRSRDSEWIVDFVATCFTGSALRWYETLSSEVQRNWDLLRNALLSHYSQVNTTKVDDLPSTQVRTSPSVILGPGILMIIRKKSQKIAACRRHLTYSPWPCYYIKYADRENAG